MLYISPVAAACKNSCDASEGLVHFSSDSHSAPQAAMAWSTNASGAGGRGVDVAAARFGGRVAVGGGGLVGRVVGRVVAVGGCVGVRVTVAVAVFVGVRVGGARDGVASIDASVRFAATVASETVLAAEAAIGRSSTNDSLMKAQKTMTIMKMLMPHTHVAIDGTGFGLGIGGGGAVRLGV